MRFSRRSRRSALVKFQAADFAAEYAVKMGWENQAASDRTLTIAPPPLAAMTAA